MMTPRTSTLDSEHASGHAKGGLYLAFFGQVPNALPVFRQAAGRAAAKAPHWREHVCCK
jgi:hypothetical protein